LLRVNIHLYHLLYLSGYTLLYILWTYKWNGHYIYTSITLSKIGVTRKSQDVLYVESLLRVSCNSFVMCKYKLELCSSLLRLNIHLYHSSLCFGQFSPLFTLNIVLKHSIILCNYYSFKKWCYKEKSRCFLCRINIQSSM